MLLYDFNPSATAATITATFYGSNGMVVSKSITVAPTGQRVVDTGAGPEVQIAAIIHGAQQWPDDL